MTPNQFTDIYKKLPDNKLLDIIDSKSDYQPLAIETAIHELKNRQLTDQQLREARQANIDIKNKNALANDKTNLKSVPVKDTNTSAFALLNPFIKKTPQRIIKVICLFLGIISIMKVFSQYSYIRYMITEATKFELPDFILFFDILFLPITLIFLWRLSKIGRPMLFIWLVFNLISGLSVLFYMYSTLGPDSPFLFLLPKTDMKSFMFNILISCGLIYFFNKKGVKALFK